MIRYVESSAILSWLFGEAHGTAIAAAIGASESVVTSELSLLECDRALLRRIAIRELDEATAGSLRMRLAEVSQAWYIEPIGSRVLERARQSFPEDAVRTLDAIHLATADVLRVALGDIEMISLDERIRSNARALGFRVLPD